MADAELVQRLRGRLIVLDGGEGCGKSTQMGRLVARLESAGLAVLAVRDPGTTRIGELIRGILLNPDHTEMRLRCEMLLYMAARAQMMSQVIQPALEAGRIVVSDRFVSSTLAYQLGGEGLSFDEIQSVARVALRDRLPDLTLIFDVPVEISRARVQAKFEQRQPTLFGVETVRLVKDRIEQRPIEYHAQVRENYLEQVRRDPIRVRRIDAGGTPDEIEHRVWSVVQEIGR
jgi:dTMP kinase